MQYELSVAVVTVLHKQCDAVDLENVIEFVFLGTTWYLIGKKPFLCIKFILGRIWGSSLGLEPKNVHGMLQPHQTRPFKAIRIDSRRFKGAVLNAGSAHMHKLEHTGPEYAEVNIPVSYFPI